MDRSADEWKGVRMCGKEYGCVERSADEWERMGMISKE